MRPVQILPNYFQKKFKSWLTAGSPFARAYGNITLKHYAVLAGERADGQGGGR